MEETRELWNLGDGLENVCNSVMRKLHYAGHVLEERNRTIEMWKKLREDAREDAREDGAE